MAPLRRHVAAAALAASACRVDHRWLEEGAHGDVAKSDASQRICWAVAAIALLDMVARASRPDARRALSWFGVGRAGADLKAVDDALLPLASHEGVPELLPYLLDTYGRTSRLDVMRDASLDPNRRARKVAGSFYTPSDVARFMVSSIAGPDGRTTRDEWWMDPACGSGVFLAAALRHRRPFATDAEMVEFATTRLTGFDVSAQACDFAAFAVLGSIATSVGDPCAAWRSIRRNLVAVDAIAASRNAAVGGLRGLVRHPEGSLRLVCNPPYASAAAGGTGLADGYPTNALYLPFVEMAWRVADGPQDSAALVVPLSLGANRGADHRRCRGALAEAGGDWTFMFFDRQPHALFGEEAKTRATIAIRRPGPAPASIRTSGLLKWTSRQRGAILDEARAVEIGRQNIARLVPKLGSREEVGLYRALEPFRTRVGPRPEPSKAAARDIVGRPAGADVFVAGTAYNFLNVFRAYPDLPGSTGALSASGVHRLRCFDAEGADAATAVLCSRIAFWLWHVECDGFHVPSWFLSDLPMLNIGFAGREAARLAELGRRAWAGLQEDVIRSVNRDRTTVAFRPTAIKAVRDEIDGRLLEAIGCGAGAAMLADFEARVVSIDGKARLAKPPAKG